MAKLYFRYGAMNSGKSTALLQVAYNYEERGQKVLLAKPVVDTKAGANIVSRLGVSRKVDFLVSPTDDVRQKFLEINATRSEPTAALLIDEAQFLMPWQVNGLMHIALEENVPVLCYGIRTDFLTQAFPGAQRLLEIAHSLEELKTICRCGKKAIFNGRMVAGNFVFDGSQISIDGGAVSYQSLCGHCYLAESGGQLGVPLAQKDG